MNRGGPRERDLGHQDLVLHAQSGHVEEIVRALAEGKNINVPNRHGVTPLMAAALWGREEAVAVLLESGAHVDAKEHCYGCTPLILACLSKNAGVVRLILEKGAKPNSADISGRTPLMAAASVGSCAALTTLLKHGADSNAQNKVGTNALEMAYRNGHTDAAKLLMKTASACAHKEPASHDAPGSSRGIS